MIIARSISGTLSSACAVAPRPLVGVTEPVPSQSGPATGLRKLLEATLTRYGPPPFGVASVNWPRLFVVALLTLAPEAETRLTRRSGQTVLIGEDASARQRM